MTHLGNICRYWGKAAKYDGAGNNIHLLIYHSLDVAAVADYWWDQSPAISHSFCLNQSLLPKKVKAWVLFFIALHDLGKFDIRFQCKSTDSWLALNPQQYQNTFPGKEVCRKFNHGSAGLHWFNQDFLSSPQHTDFAFFDAEPEPHPYQSWFAWIEAVAGHHGYILSNANLPNDLWPMPVSLPPVFGLDDKQARGEWIDVLAALFLAPAGVSVTDMPPHCSPLMAGFCSLSDWLGSWASADTFIFNQQMPSDLDAINVYYQSKQRDARLVLDRSGILSNSLNYTGVKALLEPGFHPRQLQVLVDNLPAEAGLTLIEAPTGSGKTETALAYAWRLINTQQAESIIFALPSQATANAMLERLEYLAKKIFRQPNIILAHGNARHNKLFQSIKSRGHNEQGPEEALSQCCQWLSVSNKKAFLGQIGVCTIDQVLISVLPVKHRFIRGFGIGRSVLIVDEVHAYDTYMNGLLDAVIEAQAQAGASVILLSATLPEQNQQRLLNAYSGMNTAAPPESYPLIHWRSTYTTRHYDLSDRQEHLPPRFSVHLETAYLPDMLPDAALLARMVAAAQAGAQVCLICNLVDVAQTVYRQLITTALPEIEILLFHARFTLIDRQVKEERVLGYFGKNGQRQKGRILIATQVVEQSLDVDFDWIITQLCPADLLFQRLGRLHRHARPSRPQGYEKPTATILLPTQPDYGKHAYIYGNTRVMWRTQQHIEQLKDQPLYFPDAYRQWLNAIYSPLVDEEPQWVCQGMVKFDMKEQGKRYSANQMLKWAQTHSLTDDDETIRAVTRDGEMSLPLVPYVQTAEGKMLLNGQIFEQLDETQRDETLALNRVNVPASWVNKIHTNGEESGQIWLSGLTQNGQWNDGFNLIYTFSVGMTFAIPTNPK